MSHGGTPIGATPVAVSDVETGPSLHDLIRGGKSFSGRERHCCFLNLRDGSFGNVSATSGLDLPDDGRAVARVDWDSDGDLDLWVANRNGPQLRFLENTASRHGHFIQFQLVGETCNRDAIGARVVLYENSTAGPQVQTVKAGDGFLAQSSKLLHFGLGRRQSQGSGPGWEPPSVDRVVVRWPDGQVESFARLEIDRRFRLHQGQGTPEGIDVARETKLKAGPWKPLAAGGTTRVVSVAGLPLPEFKMIELSSGKQQVVGLRGEPVVLNLWSGQCQPCLEELLEWAEAADKLRDAGLKVVALSVDQLAPSLAGGGRDQDNIANAQIVDQAKQTVSRLGLPFSCGMATKNTVKKLQLVHNYLFDSHRDLPLPTSILVDRNGQLAAFYIGRVSPETLIDDVSSLENDTTAKPEKSQLPFAGQWLQESERMSPFDFVRSLVEHDLLDDASAYIDRNRRLLNNDVEFPKLLSHLGAELLKHGRGGAVSRYQEALDQSGSGEQNGGGAEHHYNLGLAKQSQGDVKGAIVEYRQALKLDTDNFRAHNNLAAALAATGNLNQAIMHFRHVVRIDPKYAQGRFNLGNALIGIGKLEPAIEQLRAAIKLEPGYAKAHNNLAVALHRIGKTEEAREHLQEAKRLSGAK